MIAKVAFRFLTDFAKLIQDQTGSALIEGTILTPVLLALLLGVFEFSSYFYQQQLIETGVRDAARYISRMVDVPNDTTCNPSVWPTAKTIATTGYASGGSLRVTGWIASMVNFTCTQIDNSKGTYLGGADIYLIVASTTFTDPTLGFMGILGFKAPTLTISHSERVIGCESSITNGVCGS